MIEFVYSEEVKAAKAANKPILALESTIITHGMPYPQNLEMVATVERVARENGACPATIAVLDGRVHIGLEPHEYEALAKADDVMKLSRADLPYALAMKRHGATTVAATMILAERAGISVFSTGGIGGVHRGVAESFDISADLGELARSKVVVVSAGAKAILDLPKTYELLESLGVPVIGYNSPSLPAFYSRESEIASPLVMETAEDIARFWHIRQSLAYTGGALIANPIPKSAEIAANDIAPMIESALLDAAAENIGQKAVTPYLLDKIFRATKGASLAANIELVKNNVALGAEIAIAIHNFNNK